MADKPEPGAELISRHPDERFARRHARVTRRRKIAGATEMEEKLPDGDSDGELHGDQLLMAERVTAAQPGGAIRMGDVIEQIIARDNLERLVLPPARMLAPPTQQRAGPSGLKAHLQPFRRRLDTSDEDEPERPVWLPCRPHMEFYDDNHEQEEEIEPEPPRRRKNVRRRVNLFIDAEAGVDYDASNDIESDDENDDLDRFIVADDIEF